MHTETVEEYLARGDVRGMTPEDIIREIREHGGLTATQMLVVTGVHPTTSRTALRKGHLKPAGKDRIDPHSIILFLKSSGRDIPDEFLSALKYKHSE